MRSSNGVSGRKRDASQMNFKPQKFCSKGVTICEPQFRSAPSIQTTYESGERETEKRDEFSRPVV